MKTTPVAFEELPYGGHMKSKRLKALARSLAPQLGVVLVGITVSLLAAVGIIPSIPVLTSQVSRFLIEGSLGVVMLFSFLENLPAINAYFPGSIVLLVRMTSTYGNPQLALAVYLAILIPAMLANFLTFLLGSFWPQATAGPKEHGAAYHPSKKLTLWYFLTYWHPHLAAMTALIAGSKGVPLITHLKSFLPVSVFWSIVWGLLLYHIGSAFDVKSQLGSLFYIYFGIWIAWDIRKFFKDPSQYDRTTD
jgi:hypothetical protein